LPLAKLRHTIQYLKIITASIVKPPPTNKAYNNITIASHIKLHLTGNEALNPHNRYVEIEAKGSIAALTAELERVQRRMEEAVVVKRECDKKVSEALRQQEEASGQARDLASVHVGDPEAFSRKEERGESLASAVDSFYPCGLHHQR
ncbi:MAG: hypothetical protein Q9170_005878, partial [Blastenia crenularia]